MLQDIQHGDHVTIHKTADDTIPVAVGKCIDRKVIGVRINCIGGHSGLYLFSGKRHGTYGTERWARPLPESVVESTRKMIKERDERERDEKLEKSRVEAAAAYEKLPESVKLAGELQYYCDNESREKFANAPIEHLRALVEWARKTFKRKY